MIWQNLTSRKLAETDRKTPVVLPIASIEQHGPHLPVATDRLIGEHFCREIEKRIADRVLIAPTVSVGCSAHHMEFAGTLTVSHEAFGDYVTGVLESIRAHGFGNLVLFNSHGGNQAIGQVIAERFGRAHGDCRIVLATWWSIAADQLAPLCEAGPGGTGHSGEFETSLMLHIAPELVDSSAIEPSERKATFDWAEDNLLESPKAHLYRTFQQITPSGVFGSPEHASPAKGEQITAIVVPAAVKIIEDLCATA